MMGSDIHHRTEEFRKVYAAVLADLKEVIGTTNDVLSLVASGTGAMEASVSNFFSRGDKVIVCSAGKFGERWAEIAKAYGLDATVLTAEYGDVVSADQVADTLEERQRLKGVFVQARRLPPGAAHDVKGMADSDQEDRSAVRGRRHHRPRHHAARYRRLGPRRGDRRLAEVVHDPAGPGVPFGQRQGVDARRNLESAASTTST